MIRDTEGVSVYRSHGNGAFYEDENFFLQMVDNRDKSSTGWHIMCNCKIRFLLLVVPIADGAMLWFPKGDARNELNQDSAVVDTSNFENFGGYVTDTTPLEVWRTKGNVETRGKAVSTYVWDANAIELHIPDNAGLLK